jgi:hypothetical protein
MSEPVTGEWLKDPTGHHEYRYFDGMVWTQHVADGGQRDVDLHPVPFAGASATPAPAERRWEIDPVGAALAVLGSLAALIAVFLPRVESAAFLRIESNTLIQSGDGYIVIGLAIGLAGATYRSRSGGKRSIAPFVCGAVLLVVALYEGTSADALTLSRLSLTGDPVGEGVKGTPAVGIYMVGVAGALGLIGAWRMWRDSPEAASVASAEPTKRCPDCAETILAAANVCKHCGRRIDVATTVGA